MAFTNVTQDEVVGQTTTSANANTDMPRSKRSTSVITKNRWSLSRVSVEFSAHVFALPERPAEKSRRGFLISNSPTEQGETELNDRFK